MADDMDVLADQAQERALQVRDDGIDFDHFSLERLAAAESKKMLGESGGAPGGASYFRNVIGKHAFEMEIMQKQVAITEDGGEKIIEVVRDTTSELPEGFHFLGTAELIL